MSFPFWNRRKIYKMKKTKLYFIIAIFLSLLISCEKEKLSEDTLISNLPKHYILAGASGENNGNDWENAWTELPDKLERNHVYYIGDGNYPPYVFDDAENGSEFIYVFKATEDNHGTNQGWDSRFGDGQAAFESDKVNVIKFTSSYYDIDGQTGTKKELHGFRFSATSKEVDYVIVLYENNFTDIKIRHAEINHHSCSIGESGAGRGFQIHSTSTLKNGLIQHCYFHDFPNVPIYFVGNSNNNIVEFCYVARNYCDAERHAEGIQSTSNCNNNIVRHSIWEDIEGTATIVVKNGWKVYGNVIFYTPNYPNPGQGKGGIGMGIVCGISNNEVYNNTAYGLTGSNNAVYFSGDNNLVYNNIWVNCKRARFVNAEADYNAIYNFEDDGGYSEPHIQVFSEIPFTNVADFNFRLNEETLAGKPLSEEFNTDLDGNIRGSDGTWTRGAFEK
jgi:hypothetical protein